MKKEIDEIIAEARSEQRFIDNSSVEIIIEPIPSTFLASMDKDWNVQITADPKAKEICEERVKKFGIDIIDPFKKNIKKLYNHEMAHWRICPFDMNNFQDIINGCSRALILGGFDKEKTDEFFPALKLSSNMFEDIVVDGINTHRYYKQEYLEGWLTTTSVVFGNPRYKASKVITFYHDIGSRILDSKYQDSFLDKYHKEYYTIRPLVEKALKGMFPEELADKIWYNNLEESSLRNLSKELDDKRSWYKKSFDFTSSICQLLIEEKEQNKEDMNMIMGSNLLNQLFNIDSNPKGINTASAYSRNDKNKKGTGGSSYANKKKNESSTENKPGKNKSNDSIIDKIKNFYNKNIKDKKPSSRNKGKTPKYVAIKTVTPSLNQRLLEHMIQIGLGKGQEINYADNYSIINALYEEKANELIIDILEKRKPDLSTKIAYLTNEPVDPSNLSIKKILWPKTRIYQNADENTIRLYQGDLQIDVTDPLSPSKGGIPDICFIIDSSESMKADLLKEHGPYSLVLKSAYSLLNWIKRTGKYYHMEFSTINYSNNTIVSEWVKYDRIDETKKNLIHFQNGGTYLDCKKLREHYASRHNPFLAILLSDGAITNSGEVKEELINLMDAGHMLSIIHINHPNGDRIQPEIRSLENITDFHVVKTEEDIVGVKLSYGKKLWGDIL